MFEIIRREWIYFWYFFDLQFRQIFFYWALGILIGSLVCVFLKPYIHNWMASLKDISLGAWGILPASALGILSPLPALYPLPVGAVPDPSAPVVWSRSFDGDTSYLPTCVTDAEYLINLANLKGHSYGVTLSAKNHFGYLINTSRLRPPEAAGIHRFLTNQRMDAYTVLVDLMSNYHLGEKTVLYLLDGLICAPSEGSSITGENSRWQQAPFNGGYPSSLFASQDPVALDSVGADLLSNEPAMTESKSALRGNSNVENYLHEAGLIVDPPSGTVYTNGRGQAVHNLGVHEHWNNSIQKQYSRNLGKDEGIQLVRIE